MSTDVCVCVYMYECSDRFRAITKSTVSKPSTLTKPASNLILYYELVAALSGILTIHSRRKCLLNLFIPSNCRYLLERLKKGAFFMPSSAT